ncbi:MFS transporter [Spongiactinospora gelatinilytica]|uniref:Putative proline/betaine transporter n=1 Tax=Spongiactinospora gelatinilytica TaxID=2666298 RepID=A0A2W2H850_9ACTN|nr:MFS transporter [Spongiactinospora gelatinilytica]PZG48105.1 MFS transporter [Spongiactinospora gelatinilytica]
MAEPVSNAQPNATSDAATPTKARKAALAAFVGTSIEYYDYYAYATASALVFGKLFFPDTGNPFIGTMAAFATFAVGFLVRPIGGIVFGHYGDRVGRKTALVTTLVLMGGATFLIGLLPTYETAGILSPICLVLLRLAQGFAVGGEWGGAALIAVEHAPPSRKTFYSSFAQLGSPGGTVLSSAAFSLAALLGGGDLLEWAWRVPFLFSAVLVIIGLVIRLKLEESPEFQRAQKRNTVVKSPLKVTVQGSWKLILMGVGTVAVGVGGFYMTGTLFLSYAVDQVGIAQQTILSAQLIAAASSIVSFPVLAALADRYGKRLAMFSGLIGTIVIAAPHYYMAHTESAVLITLMLIVTQTVSAGAWVTIPALLSEAFPVETRYTAMSLSFQLAGVLFGGLVPVAGAGLVAMAAGSPLPAIGLLIALALINLLGATLLIRAVAAKAAAPADISERTA